MSVATYACTYVCGGKSNAAVRVGRSNASKNIALIT